MRPDDRVNVLLRNPRRELTFAGPLRVERLLEQLDIHRDTVLVIANGSLVTGDAVLADTDMVEIRPVISGGAW